MNTTAWSLIAINEFDLKNDSAVNINSILYSTLTLQNVLPNPEIDNEGITYQLSLLGYMETSVRFHSIIVGYESNVDYSEY